MIVMINMINDGKWSGTEDQKVGTCGHLVLVLVWTGVWIKLQQVDVLRNCLADRKGIEVHYIHGDPQLFAAQILFF